MTPRQMFKRRARLGLTQQQVVDGMAKLAGVHVVGREALSRYESGKRKAPRYVAKLWEQALDHLADSCGIA